MLRAGRSGPNPLVIAGLDERNIVRLKAGQPIMVPLNDFSPGMPGKLCIFYGNTPADLQRAIEPFVSETAKMSVDPRVDQEEAIRRDHKHILIATVGLPRSGKTTWARQQSWPVVNPDAIRVALHGQRFAANAEPFVWATAKVMVRALFKAGHQTVILDATNTTKKRRADWFDEEWATYWKVINTPADVCLQRARDENDTEIVPVIERMASAWEPLDETCKLWISGS